MHINYLIKKSPLFQIFTHNIYKIQVLFYTEFNLIDINVLIFTHHNLQFTLRYIEFKF